MRLTLFFGPGPGAVAGPGLVELVTFLTAGLLEASNFCCMISTCPDEEGFLTDVAVGRLVGVAVAGLVSLFALVATPVVPVAPVAPVTPDLLAIGLVLIGTLLLAANVDGRALVTDGVTDVDVVEVALGLTTGRELALLEKLDIVAALTPVGVSVVLESVGADVLIPTSVPVAVGCGAAEPADVVVVVAVAGEEE